MCRRGWPGEALLPISNYKWNGSGVTHLLGTLRKAIWLTWGCFEGMGSVEWAGPGSGSHKWAPLCCISLSGCPWILLTNKDWTSYHTHLGPRHENGGSIWPLGARHGRTHWLLPTIFPHRKSLKKTTIWNPNDNHLSPTQFSLSHTARCIGANMLHEEKASGRICHGHLPPGHHHNHHWLERVRSYSWGRNACAKAPEPSLRKQETWEGSVPVTIRVLAWPSCSGEKEMATNSITPAWRIPWTEEPGGLHSMESQSQTQLSDWHTHTHTVALDPTVWARFCPILGEQ